jgi:multidrug efflux system membrane fusion protein
MMRLISLASLCCILAACSDGAGDPATGPPPQRVRTAEVVLGPGVPTIHASGLLQAKDQANLSFKVAGIIRRILVDEGAEVEKGQLLAELERTEVGATVTQARENAAKAKRDLQRAENLYRDDVITLEQLEDARTAAAVSAAALSSAEFNSGHAAIHAPAGGTVLRRLAQERELVNSGSPVLVLSNAEEGYVVRVALADRDVVTVNLGDPATVELDAWDRYLPGVVSEVARAADPRTGTFDVEVKVDTGSLEVASGMVAKVRIRPARASNQLAYVPIGAIVEGDGRTASVYVPDASGSRVTRRRVEVAFIDGDRVALRRGATAGERVVTDGAAYLTDGASIAVLDAAAAR